MLEASGCMRCRSLLICTKFPFVICTLTGLLIDFTIHPPSHRGSSFQAVGMDNQTRSPTEDLVDSEW